MESIKYNVGNFFVDTTCSEKMRHDSLLLSNLSLWSENRKKTGRLFQAEMFFFSFFFLQIYVTSQDNKTCLLEQPILSIILQKISTFI
jgi:hypothetical protein